VSIQTRFLTKSTRAGLEQALAYGASREKWIGLFDDPTSTQDHQHVVHVERLNGIIRVPYGEQNL
jgi:hypothetical protein